MYWVALKVLSYLVMVLMSVRTQQTRKSILECQRSLSLYIYIYREREMHVNMMRERERESERMGERERDVYGVRKYVSPHIYIQYILFDPCSTTYFDTV